MDRLRRVSVADMITKNRARTPMTMPSFADANPTNAPAVEPKKTRPPAVASKPPASMKKEPREILHGETDDGRYISDLRKFKPKPTPEPPAPSAVPPSAPST